MEKKLRQIADTIHQTVYLSELESNMMSTAYFYRLHDVYQNSTVYLTFPCNRTKRYEHSYGTMELAGEMFFSSITNAEREDLESFFREAENNIVKIVTNLLGSENLPSYCASSKQNIKNCFPFYTDENIRSIINKGYESFKNIEDTALNHYMPPFSECLEKRKFLYQCLLEAVRIVALFHDVGHPPYSHIIESTLNELYDQCIEDQCIENNEYNPTRVKALKKNLEPFKDGTSSKMFCLISNPKELKAELHESIGLKMLSCAFEDVLEKEFDMLAQENEDPKDKATTVIYYITVAEFCFAILREENPFFASLHRIVDGCIDADRMDYVVRDSKNSGVNWGIIPYKRLIESCKMVKKEINKKTYYLIAYPQKMIEHIDDLILTRYKIFSRINYHHRSYKTALILQKIVKIFAEDYLKKGNAELYPGRELCPGVSKLWNCLSSTLNARDLYIIQWNDSTLISHLYQALAEIRGSDYNIYNITREQYENIMHMLEEFLLNRKHFYSVFKRQSDFTSIFNKAFKKLFPLINEIKDKERQKIVDATDLESVKAASDSMRRLNKSKLEGIIKAGDVDALERLFPASCSVKTIILDVLEKYKKDGKIESYLFDENIKRKGIGLPNKEDPSDAIYLYKAGVKGADKYNTDILEDQLCCLQKNCLQYIVYIDAKATDNDINGTIESIRNSITEKIYDSLSVFIKEIFC